MAGSDAELKAQRVECGATLSLFFLPFVIFLIHIYWGRWSMESL